MEVAWGEWESWKGSWHIGTMWDVDAIDSHRGDNRFSMYFGKSGI
jgi:hypothetical protein